MTRPVAKARRAVLALSNVLAVAALLVVCTGPALSAQAQPEAVWLMPPVPPLPPLGLQTSGTGGQPVTGRGGHPVTGLGRQPVTGLGGHPVTRPPQLPAPAPTGASMQRVYPTPWTVPFYPTVIVVAPYAWPVPAVRNGQSNGPKGQAEEPTPAGSVVLDIQPPELMQLFVDGYYVGTTADLGTALDLEPGPHRLELRATGFEPLEFGVSVRAGRVTTYRDTLKRQPVSVPVEQPPPTAVADTMPLYVIPGCYAGNTPPPASTTLPPGCDRSALTTVER